jgi:hypothetical protein
MHDQAVLTAQASECRGQGLNPTLVKNANELILRSRRIGEGAEDIEDGPYPNFPTWTNGMAHGPVEGRGKQEAEADLPHAIGHLLRRQLNTRTKGFEDIGTTDRSGHGPIAVFRHT